MLRIDLVPGRHSQDFRAVCHKRGVEAFDPHGSVHALCRRLTAQGEPDGPAEVYTPKGVLSYRVRSIHRYGQCAVYDVRGYLRVTERQVFVKGVTNQ